MSQASSLFFHFYGPIDPSKAIQILLDAGWSFGGRIFFSPIGNTDGLGFEACGLEEFDHVMSIMRKKESNEKFGIQLCWMDTEYVGDFVFNETHDELSVFFGSEVVCRQHKDNVDFSWYFERIAHPLRAGGCKLLSSKAITIF